MDLGPPRPRPPRMAETVRRTAGALGQTVRDFWDAILIVTLVLVSFFLFPVIGPTGTLMSLGGTVILVIVFLGRRVLRILADNLHFVRAQIGARPTRPPHRYIRRLFDGYAQEFDTHLLVDLRYAAPNILLGALDDVLRGPPLDVADIGCGTGLCGPLLAPFCESLVGVDLSAEMLKRAQQKGCYDALFEDDLIEFLEDRWEAYDLIVAADVLVYFGDLDAVFRAMRQALRPGGHAAFTLESTDAETWVLTRTGRYAHPRDYVRATAETMGLDVVDVSAHDLRRNLANPVAGDAWVLQRPAARGAKGVQTPPP